MRLLGTITTPATAARDNSTTAVPFLLPQHPCTLILVPAATGLLCEFKAAASVSATKGWPLGTDSYNLPYSGRETGLVGLYNPTGAPIACDVYASDASGIVVRV